MTDGGAFFPTELHPILPRQYTIPSIRGKTLTETFANHLKDDCPSLEDGGDNSTGSVDWSDVDDQQIPDSLEVSQTTTSGVEIGVGAVWMAGVGVAGTILVVRSIV